MPETVGHVEKRLRAADRLGRALLRPGRIELRVHSFGETEPSDTARHDRARGIAPRGVRSPRSGGTLGGGLRVAHDSIDCLLLGAKTAAHGDRAGDVGSVAMPGRAYVHDHHVTGAHPPVIGLVVVLRGIGPRPDDRAERRTVSPAPPECRGEKRLQLVLPHPGAHGPHRRALRLHGKGDRAADQRDLRRALAGAEAVHDRVGVPDLQGGVSVGEGADEARAARERVAFRVVGAAEVAHGVERQAGPRE